MNRPGDEPIHPWCSKCGNYYELRDGCEPTKYCDQCAHDVLDSVSAELEAAKRACTEMRAVLEASKRTSLGHPSADSWYIARDMALSTDCGRDYVHVSKLKDAQDKLHRINNMLRGV